MSVSGPPEAPLPLCCTVGLLHVSDHRGFQPLLLVLEEQAQSGPQTCTWGGGREALVVSAPSHG